MMRLVVFFACLAFTAGCSSSRETPPPSSSPKDGGPADAGPAPDAAPAYCDGGSCIQHLVVIVQENHTFDDHFGGYCTAAPGSSPTCNIGPSCCEAMPPTDPSGTARTIITDAEHASFDPDHAEACELTEIDNGKMDGYVTADGGAGCQDPRNVAIADPTLVQPYWDLAASNAIADRYFQPTVGESYANDMFLARAAFVFTDNVDAPLGAVGMTCDLGEGTPTQFTDTTIGDLLTAASVPWAWFYDGYAAMQASAPSCPPKPASCPWIFPSDPCGFEPSDVPFEYYKSTVDNPNNMKDYSAFESALTSGSLPAVSYVKGLGYENEHPGLNCTMSAGVTFATSVVSSVEASAYASSTLVLLVYDEGGGYFDHVSPPPANPLDNVPYGTRLPVLAIGPFARKNFVSHVVMEHSSIVKFIEWNWLGQQTGQLGTRDTVVNNIGSLLDPSTTGIPVPEN
jgi:phospholipase C